MLKDKGLKVDLDKLSQYWKGKKKPKRTEEHTLNIKKSNSWKTIVTPWGNFLSLLEAANDKNNTEHISKNVIKSLAEKNLQGFSIQKYN
jgi:hypothetical protein